MSLKLPKEVLEEIYDIKSLINCFSLDPSFSIFKKKLDYFKQLSSKNIPFYILIFEEILTEDNEYKNLIDILEKNNLHSAKVSMTTNGKSKYLTHPLTNIAMWARMKQRPNITHDNYHEREVLVPMFTNSHFDLKNCILKDNRKFKSILSVRKKHEVRDVLLTNIELDESICRYAGYVPYQDKKDGYDNFPTLSGLIEEYHDSYISFTIETTNIGTPIDTPQFSEKSLFAFLSGTMPIIFGGPNLCKNFKDVGLFTWNEYFGYEGDELNDDDINKIESYRRVINKVNSISKKDIKKIWIENKDKIQSNINIVADLINFRIVNPDTPSRLF